MVGHGMRQNQYWFPAKPSGFGWGPPQKWQGWVFLAGWLAAIVLTPPLPVDEYSPFVFLAGMILLLFVVVYFKGEPLRRSGRRR
jgi:hypothetical protein